VVRRRRDQTGGGVRPTAERNGTRPSSKARRNPRPSLVSATRGIGTEARQRSFHAAPTNWGRCNRRAPRSQSTGTSRTIKHSPCPGWTTVRSRGASRATGA
jgi:hypothetical protein